MVCKRVAGIYALSILALAGCASNDVLVKRQAETEAKVEHLFQVAGTGEARYNDLSARLASIEEKELARQTAIQDLEGKIRELSEVNRKLQTRLAVMAIAPVQKVELVNPEPVKGREAGPPPSYVKAFGLYSTNQFQPAIASFELFLKEQPQGEYAPNAWYWIGECYYTTNDLAKALAAFQKVVDSWPKHPKTPDALLKMGYSYGALKQNDKAKAAFERIIKSYPASPVTAKARERLMSTENQSTPKTPEKRPQ